MAPSVPDGRITLGDLVTALQPHLTPVHVPRSLDVGAARAVLYHPDEVDHVRPGDVVLGIGLPATGPGSGPVLRGLQARGAVAVLLRSGPAVGGGTDPADLGELAVVSASPQMSWTDLHISTCEVLDRGPSGAAEAPAEDLFQLCDILAELLGGSVAVEDPTFRVLAYSCASHDDPWRSAAILRRRTTAPWLRWLSSSGAERRLRTTSDVVTIDEGIVEPGARRRLVLGLHRGPELVGFVWVAEGATRLRPDAAEVVSDFSWLIAQQVVQERSDDRSGGGRRGRLLRPLLGAAGSPVELADALGVTEACRAVVTAVVTGSREADPVLQVRIGHLLALHLGHEAVPSAIAVVGDVHYCLTICASTEDKDEDRQGTLRRVVGRVSTTLRTPLLGGIGCVRPLAAVAQSRLDADRVVRALRHRPHTGPVAAMPDIRPVVAALEVRDFMRSRPYLCEGALDRLRVHDAEHGTDYVTTLAAYLDALGDVRRAAESVCIHTNTLRHRLRRITAVSGLALRDPDQLFLAQLQLRADPLPLPATAARNRLHVELGRSGHTAELRQAR